MVLVFVLFLSYISLAALLSIAPLVCGFPRRPLTTVVWVVMGPFVFYPIFAAAYIGLLLSIAWLFGL